MIELRKDYILNRYVLVSESRGKRPHQFKAKVKEEVPEEKRFFCPGHEDSTPEEIMRLPDGKGGWKVRVFPNKFAAAEMKGNPEIRTDNKYYTFSSGYGKHEVIVETPDHDRQLSDLSEEEIKDVLKVYSSRIKEISQMDGIKYVSVFKNHGKEAGTSIVHSHTQLIALNIVPSLVQEELDAIKKHDDCPYCEIIENEKKSDRRCFENDTFVAFCPYASRFHYEVWVFPKQHLKSITVVDDKMLMDLAEIMKKILVKLNEINAPYNYVLHYHDDDAYHFHIEILPRLATWAGFEHSTGMAINSVRPEDAAKFYRGED